ncbi:hypothetical protein Tco_1053178 [Tanacetum coccineum]
MEITVVTLVEEQMSPWKGNLPRLKGVTMMVYLVCKEKRWHFLGAQGDDEARGDKDVINSLQGGDEGAGVMSTSVPVIWLPFTNRNSDEAQTSEHGVQNLRTFAISAITNSSDIESG